MARLQLKESLGTQNEKTIQAEVEETKHSLKDSTMKDCVGKRITDSALECVRNAKTAKEAVEDCFD